MIIHILLIDAHLTSFLKCLLLVILLYELTFASIIRRLKLFCDPFHISLANYQAALNTTGLLLQRLWSPRSTFLILALGDAEVILVHHVQLTADHHWTRPVLGQWMLFELIDFILWVFNDVFIQFFELLFKLADVLLQTTYWACIWLSVKFLREIELLI